MQIVSDLRDDLVEEFQHQVSQSLANILADAALGVIVRWCAREPVNDNDLGPATA